MSTPTPFYGRQIEDALAEVSTVTLSALKEIFGVYAKVYSPKKRENTYSEIDLVLEYNEAADYEGKLLVTGINQDRQSVRYMWGADSMFLWIGSEESFIPDTDSKIDIGLEGTDDVLVSLRIADKPVLSGLFRVMCYKFKLVPFTQPEHDEFELVP